MNEKINEVITKRVQLMEVIVQSKRQERHITHPQARCQPVKKLKIRDVFDSGVVDDVMPIIELELAAQRIGIDEAA